MKSNLQEHLHAKLLIDKSIQKSSLIISEYYKQDKFTPTGHGFTKLMCIYLMEYYRADKITYCCEMLSKIFSTKNIVQKNIYIHQYKDINYTPICILSMYIFIFFILFTHIPRHILCTIILHLTLFLTILFYLLIC